MMYQQQSLTSTKLAAIIEQLDNDRDQVQQMASAARQARQANSTEKFIQACIQTMRRSNT
jgi:UDP-N-acetylglucosamine:LPS N-acetylglucosamine transferase